MAENLALLKDKKLWILDMDGTVYLGDRVFPETVPFLRRIACSGARALFFTNNAARSKETYVKRLCGMGIEVTASDILTSTETTLAFLTRHRAGERVFLLGTEDLKQAFRAAGVPLYNDEILASPELRAELEAFRENPFRPAPVCGVVTEGGDAVSVSGEVRHCPIVVSSFDTTLTYEKLNIACRLLRGGSEFLSTHPDFNCPVENGFIPDSGSICALLTAATGRTPRYFGKPSGDVVEIISEVTGCAREDMVVVGDRLMTDIALGAENGVTSVLVLSGETTPADLEKSDIRPDFVVENVGKLLV